MAMPGSLAAALLQRRPVWKVPLGAPLRVQGLFVEEDDCRGRPSPGQGIAGGRRCVEPSAMVDAVMQ